MTLSYNEQTYWDSPYLLSGPFRQRYFFRDADGLWRWREKAGEEWTGRGELPYSGGALCATLDMQGNPHLIILDNGAFYHLQLDGNRFSETRFYLEESKVCSHLLLAGDTETTMHLVYLAMDNRDSRWWLLHHRCTEKGWEEPRVIDFGGGSLINYGDIAVDKKNNLHLVYRIAGHEQASLYYRHFSPVSLNWSKALPLASGLDLAYPSIAVDGEQNLHTLWVAGDAAGYHIHYRAMIQGGWPAGGWKPAAVISPALAQVVFPFFNRQQEELLMGWLDQNTLTRFRYKEHSWEKMQPLSTEEAVLARHCTAGAPGGSYPSWTLISGGEPLSLAGVPPAGAVEPTENLAPQFDRLQQVSEALVHRASSLSTAKSRLEQSLEEKRKELSWISQQSKKNIQALQQSLDEKDRDMHVLEEKFKHSINELKKKMDQTRKSWEEEKKRYQGELQGIKKERRQFDLMLKEKENTIARLDRRVKEQEQQIENLIAEKEALAEELAQKNWSIKKFLGKLLHNKP